MKGPAERRHDPLREVQAGTPAAHGSADSFGIEIMRGVDRPVLVDRHPVRYTEAVADAWRALDGVAEYPPLGRRALEVVDASGERANGMARWHL